MSDFEPGSQPPNALERGLKGSCVVVDPNESRLIHTGKGEHVRNFAINLSEGAFIKGIGRVSPDNVDLWDALKDGLVDEAGNLTESGRARYDNKEIVPTEGKPTSGLTMDGLRKKFANHKKKKQRRLDANLQFTNDMMAGQPPPVDDDEPPSF